MDTFFVLFANAKSPTVPGNRQLLPGGYVLCAKPRNYCGTFVANKWRVSAYMALVSAQ